MSDDVDDFVLRYEVDSGKAEKSLERLQGAIKKTGKEGNKSIGELKHFAEGSVNELSKVAPELNGISKAMAVMSAEFVVAAAAVAVLAAGIKSFMDTRQQYNQQRLVGLDIGVSGMRMENYQRQAARYSNGTVSREQATEQLQALSNKQKAAYSDIARTGADATAFKFAGVDVGAINKGIKPFNEMLTELATNLQKLKPSEVSGYAKVLGISQDFATTLATLGPRVGQITELTAAEIQTRSDAEKKITEFNTAVTKLGDSFTNIENAIGEKFAPAMTTLVTWIGKVADAVPKWMRDWDAQTARMEANYPTLSKALPFMPGSNLAFRWWESKHNDSGLIPKDGKSVLAGTGKIIRDGDKGDKGGKSETDILVDKQDKSATLGVKSASDMQMAVAMFSGAVSSFSNAIDERQAWAAWAGEIGRAVGMGSAPSGAGKTTGINGLTPQHVYDPSGAYLPGPGKEPTTGEKIRNMFNFGSYGSRGMEPSVKVPEHISGHIKDASEQYNVPADIIKKLIYVESRFNSFAKSDKGAEGLMQLMPQIQKAYGIKNAFDSRQNIFGGTRLLRENLNATGGDMTQALLMYHGGTNRANWGKNTREYPGKVYSAPIDLMENAARAIKTADNSPIPGLEAKPYSGGKLMIPGQGDAEDRRESRRREDGTEQRERHQENIKNQGIIDQLPARGSGQFIRMSGLGTPKPETDRKTSGVGGQWPDPGYKPSGFRNFPDQQLGESKQRAQMMNVAQALAQVIGVQPGQVMRNEVPRGDIDFAYRNAVFGEKVAYMNQQKEAQNMFLPPAQRAAAVQKANSIWANLQMLQTYGPQLEGNAPEGGRSFTIGKIDVAISIDGAGSPMDTATAVRDDLTSHISDIVNNAASGVKY